MKLKILRSDTDEALINGCLKNESRAQKALYERYAPKMHAVCLRYIRDTQEAESTMLNGFVKVFEKISQFNANGSFEGWVRKIMVNESLSYIRKHKSMYLEVDIERADNEPDLNSLNSHLEVEDLLKMIQQLPTGYRTVFNLYAIEGYSHKEIAQQLGISENTSKSQLSRARTLLKNNLMDTEFQKREKDTNTKQYPDE